MDYRARLSNFPVRAAIPAWPVLRPQGARRSWTAWATRGLVSSGPIHPPHPRIGREGSTDGAWQKEGKQRWEREIGIKPATAVSSPHARRLSLSPLSLSFSLLSTVHVRVCVANRSPISSSDVNGRSIPSIPLQHWPLSNLIRPGASKQSNPRHLTRCPALPVIAFAHRDTASRVFPIYNETLLARSFT